MITLQEIFNTLATGEFSHIKLGNSQLGTIEAANYPKIVSAINLGLLDLHKKFPLRKGELILQQYSGVDTYYLREDRSATEDEMDEDYYIELGEDEDWPNDFIKINSLWEEDGNEIPLNDNKYKYDTYNTGTGMGGFTPSFDVLKMLPWNPVIKVLIEYRAKYPTIVITESFDPEKVELNIPDFIVEPLLFFVASRVFRGIASKATEGETTSTVTYSILYRTACKEIENNGLITTDDDSASNFDNNGWV